MTTVIFVHGTGTREPGYSKTLERIRSHFKEIRPDITVEPCPWGETSGAKLPDVVRSIPNYPDTRGLERQEDHYDEIALWYLLYQDPLYELRIHAALSTHGSNAFTPGMTFGAQLRQRLLNMQHNGPSQQLYRICAKAGLGVETEIADCFCSAVETVLNAEAGRTVLNLTPDTIDKTTGCIVIARAIIATMLHQEVLAESQPAVINANERKAIIEQLAEDLGVATDTRGLLEPRTLLKGLLVVAGIATKVGAMNRFFRQRMAITTDTYAYTADILLYQVRGERIRGDIRQCIQQAKPPVVLLAHSLGGIACVDLLVQESQALPVSQLITVGSQVPFLYEINALHSLSYGCSLPHTFPRWLNVYDLNDWLSYTAKGVFPGSNTITDKQVQSRQFCDQAHRAYWEDPNMWEEIKHWIDREPGSY